MELFKALFTEPLVYWTFGLPVLIILVLSIDYLLRKSVDELWGDDYEKVRTKRDHKMHN